MSKDLTIIFLTVNRVPKEWAEYQKSVLLEAAEDSPIITISKEPLDWGINLIQEDMPSVSNIYKQVLRGCKLATTPYIAIAEDDCLYHKHHFEFRPPMDTFAYDVHRWGLFTWGTPTYYYKNRISNGAMIAPRELVIQSLEERFAKYPKNNIGELGKEKGTSIDRRNTVTYEAITGMIFLSHVNSLDPTEQHKTKKRGTIRAYEIPFWGKADDIRRKWK